MTTTCPPTVRMAGRFLVAASLFFSPFIMGCSGSSHQAGSGSKSGADTFRLLDEARCQQLIRSAMVSERFTLAAPRSHTLSNGAVLRETQRFGDTPYAIALLTEQDMESLGDLIPRYDPNRKALALFKPSAKATLLLLFAPAYKYDTSTAHTHNVVTAESALTRDVLDFIHHVVRPSTSHAKPKP